MARKSKKREAGSGTIYKRKDGRWQGQYVSGRDPITGKLLRHSVYGKTQKEVATKLREATANIDRGTYQEPNQITIATYAQEYFSICAVNLAHSTQVTYQKILGKTIFFPRSARSS